MDSKAVILDKLYFTLLGYKEDIRNLNRAIALFSKDNEYCKDFNKDINMKIYSTCYGKSLKQFKSITFIYTA